MHYFSKAALLTCATLFAPPVLAAPVQSVPMSTLVKQVSIPHSTFKLKNGLTVIVHEDHKAPVVAVNVWYNVGSKDEPAGKTGFAHLFEHLMFNGSENLPGDYFKYLQQIGATDTNGTTNNDRTNYFETVPAGALERALFMESDRMGYLVGAITQDVLDNQRGVVQNEKRQGDSRPGGLTQYALFENLFPEGHPYHHTVIGSMADLDAASLADVKQWFHNRYGPNNAVLVIAGDVTTARARQLAEKYFGAIPAGPVNTPAQATVPTLAKAKQVDMKDAVAFTVISRTWAVPGVLDPKRPALAIGSSILGGLASSRLDKELVRDEKIAISVSSSYAPLHRAGLFTVQAIAKPGTDPALVAKRMDEVMANLVAKGPSADEVQRAVMSQVAGNIRGLEQVGSFSGKAQTLAEGQTFAHNSDFYKKTLAAYAAVTPTAVRTAMQQWLRRPPLTITLSPGARDANYEEAKTVAAIDKPKTQASAPAAKPTRTPPAIAPAPAFEWPEIEHVTLSNGIPVVYARRATVPLTQVALAFDAGTSADPVDQRGLAYMTAGLLEEGTEHFTSQQLAEAEERLGAQIGAGGSADRTTVSLSALTPNLGPSLDLLDEVVERPSFDPAEIDRVRAQALSGIAQMIKDPQQAGQRILSAAVYGADHPYGGAPGGDPAAVSKFQRADLVGFQKRWLRPDNVKIFIVSDRPLSEVQPQIEARFGKWAAPAVPKGVKAFPTAAPVTANGQRILLVDRPGAPQATILGAQRLAIDPRGDLVPLSTANQVLGGEFLSRINMDLRETKGWSYGSFGAPSVLANGASYVINAPVQIDRTGDSLAAINTDLNEFLTTKGVTQDELEANVVNLINSLPGDFETSGALLSAMMRNDLLGRPDNYYQTLPQRYRAQTTATLDQAARASLNPKAITWIVVGDASKIRPQLEKLGIPIETVEVK